MKRRDRNTASGDRGPVPHHARSVDRKHSELILSFSMQHKSSTSVWNNLCVIGPRGGSKCILKEVMKKKLSVREQLEQLVRETDKNISVTRVSSGRSHNRYHQSANNVLKSVS